MKLLRYISLCILLLFGGSGYSQKLISSGNNLVKVGNNILSIPFNQYSMVFDGVDEYINIDDVLINSLVSTTTGTWSCWVKPVDATPVSVEFFFSFSDEDADVDRISLTILSGGTVQFFCKQGSTVQWVLTTDGAVFSDNTWTYICGVHDGTEPIIYIDGVKPAQTFSVTTDKTKWFNGSTSLDVGIIGALNFNGGGASNHFNGNIDEVSFRNTDLTSAQISELYNNGSPKNLLKHSASGNLVSYFRMGDKGVWDGSNWTFPDQKGSNDGTSVNMEFIDRTNEKP